MGQTTAPTNPNLLAQLADAETQLHHLAHHALNQPWDDESPDVARLLAQINQHILSLYEHNQRLQRQVSDAPAPLTWSLVKFLHSQEEERSQLSQQLEHNIGQLLANAVFELASCRYLLEHDPDSVTDGLDSLQAELEQGLADLRWFVANLEPQNLLGSFGLSGGMRRYLEQFEAKTGLQATLNVQTNLGRLPRLIEVATFRVLQEALQNVAQHAQASQVTVLFQEFPEQGLQFSVTDDGNGLNSDVSDLIKKKNLGFARMMDYTELLRGSLELTSSAKHGTTVLLTYPYPKL